MHSGDQIVLPEFGDTAERDLKVGLSIPVHVSGKHAIAESKVTSLAGEARAVDPMEVLIANAERVRVYCVEVDCVHAGGEVGDRVAFGSSYRVGQARENECI